MPATALSLSPCPVWFGGEWRDLNGAAATPVHNPSTGDVIAEAPLCTAAHVNEAVEAAAAAFPAWMETPPVERARILFKFKALLEENFEDLVRTNTREHGKTLVESRGDVKRGMEVVEFALGVPSLLMGEVLENVARGIDCEAIRQPLGVCAGITPFNFPAMVPLWMYPIAIACGNTREHGKTLVESRGDVKRGMEVVEFALGVPSLLMGEVLENVARGIDCEAIRQPLGVCAGITPFNFPAMVPLWMYPIAIACGN